MLNNHSAVLNNYSAVQNDYSVIWNIKFYREKRIIGKGERNFVALSMKQCIVVICSDEQYQLCGC